MSFNIVVLAKQVIDPEAPSASYRIDGSAGKLEVDSSQKIAPVINGFCENAIEAALQIKEAVGDATVSVISAGSEFVMDVMKKAVSMGSDEMYLLQDDKFSNLNDSSITAKLLATAIQKIGQYDLVLAGMQASDWDQAQVPLGIAEILGVPCVPIARKIEIKDGRAICERATDTGYETVSAPLPSVITVNNEFGQPRYPTLRNIMAAARKTPITWDAAELGLSDDDLSPRIKIVDLFIPEKQSQCEIIEGEDEEEMGKNLALKMREAKLI